MVDQENDHRMIIDIPKQLHSLKISYELYQKNGDPSDIHETIIRKDLIHSTGYGLFALPDDIETKDILKFSVNWQGIPSKWSSLSSHSTGRAISFTASIHELLHAAYIAGKIRVYRLMNDSNPVFLSLYGKFNTNDQNIASSLEKIIKNQRSFFKYHDFPYYAISLVEGKEPGSMGGISLHNSFLAYLPLDMDKTDYYILFAHEHLHNWLGGKIKNNDQEELNYWWTEGFTDYYSRVIELRSGGISIECFVSECNRFLRDYYLSPVINEPNARIQQDFRKDYNIKKLPYYRGFVFAIYLENLIKQNNPNISLDNLMLDLFEISKQQEFSVEYFKKIAEKYIPQGIDNELLDFIDTGKTIDLENAMHSLPLEKIKMGRYDRGFDKKSFIEESTIKNIDINSNAYKSGLRDGDKIIEWYFPKGADPDQLVTVKTLDKTFEFRPECKNRIDIYQFKSDLTWEDKLKVKRFFGSK